MNPATEETPDIDVGVILSIHRDPDGYIGFTRKPDPATAALDKRGKPYAWENLFSIRAGDLRNMFPALAGWLLHDSYMTINSMYRPAPWDNRTTGRPDVWRKEKDLGVLNTCYADIDAGRPESTEPGGSLSWREAQHRAEYMADTGVIPQPSIIARSGRGVYLLWLLHDDDDLHRPPHAWPEKTALSKDINRAIGERLRNGYLPADRAAIDAARVLRVPGSIHRGAGRRVTYVLQADQYGKGFTYTLGELAEYMGVPTGELPQGTRKKARPATFRRTVKKGSAPLRSKGPLGLNALRASDLLTLHRARGGFCKRGEKHPDGTPSPGRRFLLTLYGSFLRFSGETVDHALVAVRSMAESMAPAWPDEPGDPTIDELVGDVYQARPRQWRSETLCSLLGVSVDQARELELQSIAPNALRIERDQARPTQADLIKDRRSFARWYIEKYGMISGHKLANVYRQKGFKGANHTTANQDLNALGYETPGHRRRKAHPG